MILQNQEDYEVQKILDKKVFNGKTLYLVKWKNFPIEQATWQCNKILLSAKDKIRQFKYSQKGLENLENTKFEQDTHFVSEVRDAFKRKRGRPPKIHLNSIRSVINSHRNYDMENLNESSLPKRGRGRPRGSKNKKSLSFARTDSSEESFDSKDNDTDQGSDEENVQNGFNDLEKDLNEKKMKKTKKNFKITRKLNETASIQDIELQIVETSEQLIPEKEKRNETQIEKLFDFMEKTQTENKLLNVVQTVQKDKVQEIPIQSIQIQVDGKQNSNTDKKSEAISPLSQQQMNLLREFFDQTIKKVQSLQKIFGFDNLLNPSSDKKFNQFEQHSRQNNHHVSQKENHKNRQIIGMEEAKLRDENSMNKSHKPLQERLLQMLKSGVMVEKKQRDSSILIQNESETSTNQSKALKNKNQERNIKTKGTQRNSNDRSSNTLKKDPLIKTEISQKLSNVQLLV